MKKTTNKFYQRVLALALAVMLCVGMMPMTVFAVDGESQVPTHTHNEGGWICTQGEATKVLTCEKHVHTDECSKTESVLTCETEEHTHGDECYDADGNLTCETQEHTHGDGCYKTETVKVCEQEDHTHGDECYNVKEGEWTCTAPVAEPSPEPSPAPTCTCETKCKAGEVNTACPVCGAEGASLDDCTGKYLVRVQTTWSVTNVTAILTGANGETYTVSCDSWADNMLEFKVDTKQKYTCKVTAVNEDGENIKGSCTVYPFMVNGDPATVSNFLVDVNGKITFAASFINPIPAENGQKFIFSNVTAYLQATDGTKYDLVRDKNGNYSALIPANQPYELHASGWTYHRFDGSDDNVSIKHSFGPLVWPVSDSITAQNYRQPYPVSVEDVRTENVDVEDFTAKLAIEDTGNTERHYKVTVTTDYGKVVEQEVDDIYFDLTLPGSIHSKNNDEEVIYTVTVTDLDKENRSVTKEFSVAKLKNSSSERLWVVFPVNHFDVKVNMYADGKFMSTYTKEDVPRGKYDNRVVTYSEAVKPERAEFVKAEAFDSEGNPLNTYFYDSFVDGGGNGDFVRYDVDAKDLEPGETITVNFYYKYVDQETEYPVTVTHIFRSANGDPIESATRTYVLPTKPGSRLNVSALRNAGEDWYQPATPIEGYENRPGAWFMGYNSVKGGEPNGLIGYVNNESKLDVSMDMIHGGVEIEFYYSFGDKYVQYIANNDAAEGGMYIDWCRAGAIKTIKNNRYTYDGFVFTGWNLASDNSGTAYQPGDKVEVFENISLFAQWRPCNVTVRYVDEAGNELREPVEVKTDAGRYDVRSYRPYSIITTNGDRYDYVKADRELTGTVKEDTIITLVYSFAPTPPQSPDPSPSADPTPSEDPDPTDIPDPTPPLTETPDVTPTPDVPPVTPDPDPSEPPVEIPDDDPPLAEIPDDDPPLAETPDDTTEIDDEEVPLADVPKTGDDAKIWLTLALLSAAGLGVLGLTQRRTRKSGKHS